MSFGVRALVWLLCFTVDIQVKANPISLPEGCISQEVYPCAYKSSQSDQLALVGATLVLAPATVVTLQDQQKTHLVSGVMWIQATHSLILTTPFGAIRGKEGSVWVAARLSQSIDLYTVSGTVEVLRRGTSKWDSVPAGLHLSLGPMSRGEAVLGWPEPFQPHELVSVVDKIGPAAIQSLRQRLEVVRSQWREAIIEVSQITQNQALRMIAQADEQARLRRIAREREENETKRLHKMFDDRVHFRDLDTPKK